MFVGQEIIITGVNIEHGANASLGQERNFALTVRLRFKLNLVLLCWANARQHNRIRDERGKSETMCCA